MKINPSAISRSKFKKLLSLSLGASLLGVSSLSSPYVFAQLLEEPPAIPTNPALPQPEPTSIDAQLGVEASGSDAGISITDEDIEAVEADGITPMLRGPMHEAFAERFDVDGEEPIHIDKEPPQAIDEQPPQEQPEGENFTWIPGYWGWDIEKDDFVWVSGIWRQVPPGTQWIPGYWTEMDGGWQWVSGFWATDAQEQIVYLPAPPQSIDNGPSSPAPGDDYFWIPGCWEYQGGDYAWQSGYWSVGQNDWVWVPTRYVWTPSGYVHRTGYWDYRLPNRGVLYTPIAVGSGFSGVYRPRYVLDINPLLLANLFVARGFNQYYYGNHFSYRGNRQVYPWVSYYQHGYDPLLSYYAYQGRHQGWLRQLNQLEREISRTPNLQSQATVAAQLRAQRDWRNDKGRNDFNANTWLRVAAASNLANGNRTDFRAPISLAVNNQSNANLGRDWVDPFRDFAKKRKDLEKASTDIDRQRASLSLSDRSKIDVPVNKDGKIELKQLSLQRPDRGGEQRRGKPAIPSDAVLGSKLEDVVRSDRDRGNPPRDIGNAARNELDKITGRDNDRSPGGANRPGDDNRPNNENRSRDNAVRERLSREDRAKQLAPVLGDNANKPLNQEQWKDLRSSLLGGSGSNNRDPNRTPSPNRNRNDLNGSIEGSGRVQGDIRSAKPPVPNVNVDGQASGRADARLPVPELPKPNAGNRPQRGERPDLGTRPERGDRGVIPSPVAPSNPLPKTPNVPRGEGLNPLGDALNRGSSAPGRPQSSSRPQPPNLGSGNAKPKPPSGGLPNPGGLLNGGSGGANRGNLGIPGGSGLNPGGAIQRGGNRPSAPGRPSGQPGRGAGGREGRGNRDK